MIISNNRIRVEGSLWGIKEGEYLRCWGDEGNMYCERATWGGKWENGLYRVRRGCIGVPKGVLVRCGEGEELGEEELSGGIWRLWGLGMSPAGTSLDRGLAIGVVAGGLSEGELALIEKGMENLRTCGGFLLGEHGGFNVKEAEKCVAGLTAMMLKDYFYFGEEMEKGLVATEGLEGKALKEAVGINSEIRKERMRMFQERVKLGGVVSNELKWMLERGSGDEASESLMKLGDSMKKVQVVEVEE